MAFEEIIEFLKQNYLYIVLVVIAFFLMMTLLRNRKSLKPVKRSEIERRAFINRMLKNKPKDFKFISRYDKVMGKIKFLRMTQINKDNKITNVHELVVQPTLFNLKWAIPNIFERDFCLIVSADSCEYDDNTIYVKYETFFDLIWGIYYDRKIENPITPVLINDNIIRQDMDNLSSIYWAKAQESAVINPPYAKEAMLEELKLQQLKEERAKKMTEGG